MYIYLYLYVYIYIQHIYVYIYIYNIYIYIQYIYIHTVYGVHVRCKDFLHLVQTSYSPLPRLGRWDMPRQRCLREKPLAPRGMMLGPAWPTLTRVEPTARSDVGISKQQSKNERNYARSNEHG